MVNCFCGDKAVFNGEKLLCSVHLSEWLSDVVNKEFDKYIESNDVLAVAVSGGKDSTTLLDLVHQWTMKNKNKLFAISINEGIKGYRKNTLNFLRKFCDEKKIKLFVYDFENEVGKNLDDIIKIRNKKKFSEKACTICGVFRRYLLNKYARKLGATKILFAHNQDDEVQTFIMNLFIGNLSQMMTKGELGGVVNHPNFVVRFKPLINIPEKALAVYTLLNYPTLPKSECPYSEESVRSDSRRFVNKLEQNSKSSKQKILDTYLKKILPVLKQQSKKIQTQINDCEECGEPSSQKKCNFCKLTENLF